MEFLCSVCGSPLVLSTGGDSFECARECCFERLPAAGERPYDIAPHDGPDAAERIIGAKERLVDLAQDCFADNHLTREEYLAAIGLILDTESLLHLGRIRRSFSARLAQGGKAS